MNAGSRPLDAVALAAAGGAVLAGTAVAPLVLWNGPLEALLIYPPLAAIPGAVLGAAVGCVVAAIGRVSARRSDAGAAGGTGSPGSSPAPGR